MMKKDNVAGSTFWTGLAITVSQSVPSWIGRPAAWLIGAFIANNPYNSIVQALRLNQWVINDGKLTPRELKRAVRLVYQHQAKSLYETYHYMFRKNRVRDLVGFSPKFVKLIEDQASSSRGLILLVPHLCGFDMGGFALAAYGFKFLTLSYPNPPGGYKWQNKIREEHGMDVMPFSITALREARVRLEAGGTVLTGLDRPNPESGYSPRFFGRPAALPVSYVRLALKTNARVYVVGVEAEGKRYMINVSDEIPMIPSEDGHQEIIQNAERVLKEAEVFIRRNSTYWAMFYPVWPEASDEIPGV